MHQVHMRMISEELQEIAKYFTFKIY